MTTKTIEYGAGLTKTEKAVIAEAIARKVAADKAARAEGRICACEGPHLATCTAE